MNSDIYLMDLETGRVKRLTDHPGWDEHAYFSPDGQKVAWISSRFHPTPLEELTSLPPLLDFFLIQPLFFAEFINPPVGYITELYLMDADGSNVQRLTFDQQITVANGWSPDGAKLAFGTTTMGFFTHSAKVMAFDCR